MDAAVNLTQLLEGQAGFTALRGTETEQLLGQFKRLSLTTGRAVYHWTPANGLYRLGSEHILIPRTRQPADVLTYILSSRHFGVYLLQGLGDSLAKQSLQRLVRRVAEKTDGVQRLVLLVDDATMVPRELEDVIRSVEAAPQRHAGTA